MPDAFISYNRKDQVLVKKIVEQLISNGLDICFDLYKDKGTEWIDWIEKNLPASGCFVYFASFYGEGDWQNKERDLALLKNKPVIPVFLPEVDPAYYGFIATYDGILWQDEEWDEDACRELIESIRKYAQEPSEPMPAPPNERHLSEVHTLIGRDEECAQVLGFVNEIEQTHKGKLVLITGQPGFGINVFMDHMANVLREKEYRVYQSAFSIQQFRKQAINDIRWRDAYNVYKPFFDNQGGNWRQLDMQVLQILLSQCFIQIPEDVSKATYLPTSPSDCTHSFRMMVDQGKPLIIILENLENASPFWLNQFTQHLLPEMNNGLPILIMISLHAHTALHELGAIEELAVHRWARDLIASEHGTEVHLTRASHSDVKKFIAPASTRVVDSLYGMSGGIPTIVENLWQEWLNRGEVIRNNDGKYQFRKESLWQRCGTARDYVSLILDQLPYENEDFAILGKNIQDRKDKLATLLSYAALEGQAFTPRALAACFQMEEDSLLTVLEYLIDEDDDPGLIQFLDPHSIVVNNKIIDEVEQCQFLPMVAWHGLRHYPFGALSPELIRVYTLEMQDIFALDIYHAINSLMTMAQTLGDGELYERYAAIRYYQTDNRYTPFLLHIDILLGKARREREHTAEIELIEDWRWDDDLLFDEDAMDLPGSVPTNQRQDAFQTTIFELISELWNMDYFQNHPIEAVVLIDNLFAESTLVFDNHNEGFFLLFQGTSLVNMGEYELSIRKLRQSLDLAEKLKNSSLIVDCWYGLGNAKYSLGNYEAARDLFQQALQLNQQLGRQGNIADCWHSLGNVEYSLGNYEAARKLYQQALQLNQQLGQQDGIAGCWHSLGDVEQNLGNYEAARKLYQQALQLNQELGQQEGIAFCWASLGDVEHSFGNYEDARKLYQQALQLNQELGRQHKVTRCQEKLQELENMNGKTNPTV